MAYRSEKLRYIAIVIRNAYRPLNWLSCYRTKLETCG
jgi:hypothetical protein